MERYIPGPAGGYYMSEDTNIESTDPKSSITAHRAAWLAMQKDLFQFEEGSVDCQESISSNPFKVQRSDVADIADVADGTYDLKVPRIIAQVTSMTHSSSGDWTIELQDSTGQLNASLSVLHMQKLQETNQHFTVGCVVLLENVSVMVSSQPFIRRHLCVHPRCVVAVWR